MKKIKWPGIAIVCVLLFSMPLSIAALSVVEHRSIDPVAQSWKDLKVRDFIKLSAKDYSSLIGRKLNLKEKIAFKVMKIKMKHQLKKQPDLLVTDYLTTEGGISRGWMIAIVLVVVIFIIIFLVRPSINIGPF